MNKIIVIVGPTAVGKTALSIELAKKYDGEIISGDSMQVYKGLDIGTAKITEAEKAGIPHYLIDTKEITDNFTVAEWVTAAQAHIADITARGKMPIIVGGTGFYIAALLGDMPLGGEGADADDEIRAKWQAFADDFGGMAVWDELNEIDPVAAKEIPAANVRRIIRALEVYELTGKPFSEQQPTKGERQYDALVIGLNTSRELLYDRINLRVDQMLDDGLIAEAKRLYDAGGAQLQSGQGIGYKELFPFFGEYDTEERAIELIKRNSRRFAKRQLTWFNNQMPDIHWFDLVRQPAELEAIDALVETFNK